MPVVRKTYGRIFVWGRWCVAYRSKSVHVFSSWILIGNVTDIFHNRCASVELLFHSTITWPDYSKNIGL